MEIPKQPSWFLSARWVALMSAEGMSNRRFDFIGFINRIVELFESECIGVIYSISVIRFCCIIIFG